VVPFLKKKKKERCPGLEEMRRVGGKKKWGSGKLIGAFIADVSGTFTCTKKNAFAAAAHQLTFLTHSDMTMT
jgi:hypothetical protein